MQSLTKLANSFEACADNNLSVFIVQIALYVYSRLKKRLACLRFSLSIILLSKINTVALPAKELSQQIGSGSQRSKPSLLSHQQRCPMILQLAIPSTLAHDRHVGNE